MKTLVCFVAGALSQKLEETNSHEWWDTDCDVDVFTSLSQDPGFYLPESSTSADVRAEHVHNSLVEAQYLLDTGKSSDTLDINGFTDEQLISLLLNAQDFTQIRQLVRELVRQEEDLRLGSSSGYSVVQPA